MYAALPSINENESLISSESKDVASYLNDVHSMEVDPPLFVENQNDITANNTALIPATSSITDEYPSSGSNVVTFYIIEIVEAQPIPNNPPYVEDEKNMNRRVILKIIFLKKTFL